MSVPMTNEQSAHWTPLPEFAHLHAHITYTYYISCIRMRIQIRTHILIHIHICIHMRMRVHVNIDIYVNVHVHKHTCTHTYTQTYKTDETTYHFVTVTNLALHKPTWQHSTWVGGVASRAVDGNPNPNFSAGSCTHKSPLISSLGCWSTNYVYCVLCWNNAKRFI